MKPSLIHAICTPLRDDESLHRDGLEAHLNAQWQHGASGLLVGGTMGLMQLLKAETFSDLTTFSAALSRGRGEVLVGVGDTSYERTLERIRMAELPGVDGLVVVTPFFFKFKADDLVDYYRTLAAESAKPIFVYYLPALTGVTLSIDTVLQLAQLPNVAGIKSSAEFTWTNSLMERAPSHFRVITAAPTLLAKLARAGVTEQLDGIFSVVPAHTEKMVRAVEAGDWTQAGLLQSQLNALLGLLIQNYEIFPGCTALLNAQGIPGQYAIRPMKALSPERTAALLNESAVRQCLSLADLTPSGA